MKFAILLVFALGFYSKMVSAQNYKCRGAMAIGRDPVDCRKWFKCAHGIAYPMPSCANGLVFSKVAHICVRTTSHWNDCPAGGKASIDRCSKSNSIVFPKTDNCAQFYNCSLKVNPRQPGLLENYLDECPYPELFSDISLKCEYFEDVSCGRRKEMVFACDYRMLQCPVKSGCIPCRDEFPDCRRLPDGLNVWKGKETTSYYASCYKGRGFPEKCPTRYGRKQSFSAETKKCELKGFLYLFSFNRR